MKSVPAPRDAPQGYETVTRGHTKPLKKVPAEEYDGEDEPDISQAFGPWPHGTGEVVPANWRKSSRTSLPLSSVRVRISGTGLSA